MSEANREVLRQCFALHRLRHYREIMERFFHEDAEWVDPPEFPDASLHRGREEIVAFLISWEESWEGDFEMRLGEIVGDGDKLVTLGTFHGTGKGSGIPTSVEYAQIWIFRDGKIARTEVTFDREAALAAVAPGDDA